MDSAPAHKVQVTIIVPNHLVVRETPDTPAVLDMIERTVAVARAAVEPKALCEALHGIVQMCIGEMGAVEQQPDRLIAADARVCGRCQHWEQPVRLALPGPGARSIVPEAGGCKIDRRSKCKARSGACDDFEVQT